MSTIESYTDATRPSASTNSGLCIFNTSSNAIEVSDGTSWFAYNNDGTTGNSLSLEFDGGDRLDTTYSMTSVQDYTVMFWMKSTDTINYICPVADTTSGQVRGNLELMRVANQTDFYVIFKDTSPTGNNAKNGVTSFNDLCDGDWHHVALVFDSSGTYTNVTVYKDGDPHVEGGEDARTANGWQSDLKTYGTSSAAFAFGQKRNNTVPYTGKMDQMAFFESALTSTEVSTIYNSGNGGDLLTLGFSPDAYYRVGYYSEDTNSDGSVASAGNDILTVADYSGNNNDASQATASLKPNYVADPAF